MKITLHTS